MKQYQALLTRILETGIRQPNRTGIDTIMVPGAIFQHDMALGFPALTTKKLYYPGVVGELCGFLRGYTNNDQFKALGCNVWTANAEAPGWLDNPAFNGQLGDMGEVYGYQWRNTETSRGQVILVPPRSMPEDCGFSTLEDAHFDGLHDPKHPLVGTTLTHPKYGDFSIGPHIHLAGRGGSHQVQFKLTGYVSKPLRSDAISKLRVRDVYMPIVSGVGYMGEVETPLTKEDSLLRGSWAKMLKRCYSTTSKEYPNYGAKGVTVCSAWYNFSVFLNDVKSLPNWLSKQRHPDQYELDKDYFGGAGYSKETCVWLTISDNIAYRHARLFEATTPTGNVIRALNHTHFADAYDLAPSKVTACLNGTRKHHKGYTFKYVSTGGLLPRYALHIDQLKNALNDIANNPTSRRIIVNAWNPTKINQACLPPCHTGFQFLCDTVNQRLHLCWSQRSVDTGLGLPYNIASYATLLEWVAHATGYTPGILIGFLADTHIYVNHIDPLKEQLTREPYPLPTLVFPTKPEGVSPLHYLENIDPATVFLKDYQHHPAVKMDMAV